MRVPDCAFTYPYAMLIPPLALGVCVTCDRLVIRSACGTKIVKGPLPLSSLYFWRGEGEQLEWKRATWDQLGASMDLLWKDSDSEKPDCSTPSPNENMNAHREVGPAGQRSPSRT